jgi:hypothetical protein
MQSIKRVEKVSTWSTQLRNSFFHLQAADAYQTIADDFSALIHRIQFNQVQQAAFARLRALPGGFDLIQGALALENLLGGPSFSPVPCIQ